MVSAPPLIFKTFTLFTNTLVTVPFTNSITFIFPLFFSVLRHGLGTYISFRFLSILQCGLPRRRSPLFGRFIFCCCWLSLGLVVWPKLDDPFVYQNPREFLCVSFSRTDSGLCTYHFSVWSNSNFWHNFAWITFPTQLCRVLYPFYDNLTHSLMWLFISCLSPHNQHLQFYCLIYFPFNIVGPYGVVFELLLKRFNFSLKVSTFLTISKFSRVRFRAFDAWNIHTVIFFQFLFSSNCCSVYLVLSVMIPISIISLHLDFFYVVFELLYRCINTIFNVMRPLPSYFDTNCLSILSLWCKV